MEIGEKVCLRSVRGGSGEKPKDLSRILGAAKEKDKESREGFDIMANVIWAEFGRAIMDEMGSVVFAAGRPDEFRKVRQHSPLNICD